MEKKEKQQQQGIRPVKVSAKLFLTARVTGAGNESRSALCLLAYPSTRLFGLFCRRSPREEGQDQSLLGTDLSTGTVNQPHVGYGIDISR